MLFNDILFNNALDNTKVTKSGLCGATVNPYKRIGDLQNVISVGSVGLFNTANLIKENPPYYKEYDINGNLGVIPSLHFLVGLRRQLSGDIEAGTSTFSPEETQFYLDFQEWQMGIIKTGDLLTALEYLDNWLIDELLGNAHPTLSRSYNENNKWYKILKRGAV